MSVSTPASEIRRDSIPKHPRESRPQKPLPSTPPYIAYVGNLVYDVIESDIEEFLSGTDVEIFLMLDCQHQNC
jgi:hypothetical protein